MDQSNKAAADGSLAGLFYRDESGLLHQVHPEAVKAYPNDPGRIALYLGPVSAQQSMMVPLADDLKSVWIDGLGEVRLCGTDCAGRPAASLLQPVGDPDDDRDFCAWMTDHDIGQSNKWVAWGAWCEALSRAAAAQGTSEAAPDAALVRRIEELEQRERVLLGALEEARPLVVEMRGYMDRMGQQGIRERVDTWLATGDDLARTQTAPMLAPRTEGEEFLRLREQAWREASSLKALGVDAPRSPKFDEWFEAGWRAHAGHTAAAHAVPFGYFHQLLDHEGQGNGIWMGCAKRAVVEQSYTEGETGREIVALYAASAAGAPPFSCDEVLRMAVACGWPDPTPNLDKFPAEINRWLARMQRFAEAARAARTRSADDPSGADATGGTSARVADAPAALREAYMALDSARQMFHCITDCTDIGQIGHYAIHGHSTVDRWLTQHPLATLPGGVRTQDKEAN